MNDWLAGTVADMARTAEMFEKPPRAKPRVMMKADDHGEFPDGREAAHFVCATCGYKEWLACTRIEGRRGMACETCNAVPANAEVERRRQPSDSNALLGGIAP